MENRAIEIDPNCFNEFEKLKIKYNIESVFLKLNDNFNLLYVEKTLSQISHDDFLESIPVDQPRLIIYKKHSNNKIIFIRWIPEIVQDKIEYSYSNASTAILELLIGINEYMEVKDLIELSNL
ncbi:hypothetical protein ACTFIY_002891 [Dictyostelium cf. discoideum]